MVSLECIPASYDGSTENHPILEDRWTKTIWFNADVIICEIAKTLEQIILLLTDSPALHLSEEESGCV